MVHLQAETVKGRQFQLTVCPRYIVVDLHVKYVSVTLATTLP